MSRTEPVGAVTPSQRIMLLPRLLAARPRSFRSRFARDRAALLARPVPPAPVVTEADLAPLPPLMQRYLRRVGSVGRPRVHNEVFSVTFS